MIEQSRDCLRQNYEQGVSPDPREAQSEPMTNSGGFLPRHGNYRALKSFRKAEIIYDLTHRFCTRFLDRRDRTIDQMVQAARSGKQNIIEGTKAARTSKATELRLIGVARASLEELLGDYEDALRVRRAIIWSKEAPEAKYVRRRGARETISYEDFREFAETRPIEIVANIALCLIHQANYLLDRQIQRLEQDFLKEGDLRERMAAARRKDRKPQT